MSQINYQQMWQGKVMFEMAVKMLTEAVYPGCGPATNWSEFVQTAAHLTGVPLPEIYYACIDTAMMERARQFNDAVIYYRDGFPQWADRKIELSRDPRAELVRDYINIRPACTWSDWVASHVGGDK